MWYAKYEKAIAISGERDTIQWCRIKNGDISIHMWMYVCNFVL